MISCFLSPLARAAEMASNYGNRRIVYRVALESLFADKASLSGHGIDSAVGFKVGECLFTVFMFTPASAAMDRIDGSCECGANVPTRIRVSS